jgi:hypothetical protein
VSRPGPLFTPGKDPVPIVQEVGWAPGPTWRGAENLAPQRDSIPGPSQPEAIRYTDYVTRPTQNGKKRSSLPSYEGCTKALDAQ